MTLRVNSFPARLVLFGFVLFGIIGCASTPTGKMQKDRYLNTPQYQREAPFAKNPPAVDFMYNSAFDESLYSPFSFNN